MTEGEKPATCRHHPETYDNFRSRFVEWLLGSELFRDLRDVYGGLVLYSEGDHMSSGL